MIWSMQDTEALEFIGISFICGLPLFWLLVCGFPDWMKPKKKSKQQNYTKVDSQ